MSLGNQMVSNETTLNAIRVEIKNINHQNVTKIIKIGLANVNQLFIQITRAENQMIKPTKHLILMKSI